ncbi:Vacuolar iron transporter-like 4 [Spatholobus suberectus]|nr:Vacuolar iron transporter-like 4 [Spatholobus suberectus]
MANLIQPCHDHDPAASPSKVKDPSKMLNSDVEGQGEEKGFDYAKRAQWLRAAVLGANDGLLSTASLMMGVGAVREDVKTMMLSGVAGLVGGACSMAIGEFVSVYSQYDIELAQMKREGNMDKKDKEKLPNPYYAAFASALTFALGAGVPLLGAAFVKSYKARLGVMVAVVSLALIVFGTLGAYIGKAPMVKSTSRVLIGGWMAMAITFGLTKLVDHVGV